MIENNSVEHVTMTKLQQGNALLVVFLFFVETFLFFSGTFNLAWERQARECMKAWSGCHGN